MERHVRDQLVLDLDSGRRRPESMPAPEGLLQALADLLLEALGGPGKEMQTARGVHDASEDHF